MIQMETLRKIIEKATRDDNLAKYEQVERVLCKLTAKVDNRGLGLACAGLGLAKQGHFSSAAFNFSMATCEIEWAKRQAEIKRQWEERWNS